ncbi:UDP-glucose/GDP-mannose dehydrogenase family protein [Candidatus Synechococcus calcipolaris G9]|uniref:UDP-glucose 6-dehydrogenase n=1 Tax=Candidatus Synechococcus calcipolaris G9 TaxID=1497997 RepID=A0ABT6F2M7_9SYNE|nr:UDP-glucose/GDP-mannose dehydrogenase family protein [Candidatus Synechococcus calcipolaris]MDG2992038.1 UDP-glucose/GDP-mannose dehydrogenase family protein [Candidatus Synechococcus calcipolaris G9]
MRVCVIGTGYVGLVTGACLAHIGHDVICIDNNIEKVKLLQSGQSPIYEPGLTDILRQVIDSGNIKFTSDLAQGINHGDILFIAVGTPALATGETDTRYVEAVAKGIGAHLNEGYKVIVNKSTVPIGSGDWVRMLVLDGVAERDNTLVEAIKSNATYPPLNFDVVSNPEFLREGSAVYDTFNPDRIVLGGSSDKAIALMKELYAPIINRTVAADQTLPPVPVLVTDLSSAEMIKYAANAFLATKISFINEVANICDRVGADVVQVAKGIGLDSRIGNKFLQAGLGWGGSCFPKDVSALIHTANDYGYEAELLNSAVHVNHKQRYIVIEKLQRVLKILKGKTVGLLGLTFKPNTDDLRDAPALNLIEELNRLGAKVKAYDPLVSQSGLRSGLSNVIVETDVFQLADGCDALVLVTDWQQFLDLDYGKIATLMEQPIMIDGRNFLDRKALEELGFNYVGVGH